MAIHTATAEASRVYSISVIIIVANQSLNQLFCIIEIVQMPVSQLAVCEQVLITRKKCINCN